MIQIQKIDTFKSKQHIRLCKTMIQIQKIYASNVVIQKQQTHTHPLMN